MTGAQEVLAGTTDQFTAAIASGNADAAERSARALLTGGTPLLALYELMTETLECIGRCWQSGEISIADEHLATAAATRVVTRLRGAPPHAVRGTVVLSTLPGERHTLGLEVLAHLFEEARFGAVVLGDLPTSDLLDVVSRTESVRAVLLSCHRLPARKSLRTAVVAVRAAAPGAHVLAGGPAFAGIGAADNQYGAHAIRTTARDALDTVDALTSPLTRREAEVLELVADGLTNKEIADRLGVAASTVKDHVESLAGKLDASTRTGAVSAAFRIGLLR